MNLIPSKSVSSDGTRDFRKSTHMKTTNIASVWPLLLALILGVYLFEFATPVEAAPKKLLVVTVTKGFRHSSIPTAEKILGELAQKSGSFTVDYARNDDEIKEKMTPA